jgi:hypothetical protein
MEEQPMCLPFTDLNERLLGKGEHAGFEWNIVHNRSGYRCGYVRVLHGHPWFGKDYYDVPAEVHGGLNFAQAGKACETHGEKDEWWLGFDCGHGGDAQDPSLPSVFKMPLFGGEAVRTQEYVEAECRSLCEQAAAALN